jgi:hypothetical protein
MTNAREPRLAVTEEDTVASDSQDEDLSNLVRRWLAGSRQSRERDNVLRVAPTPDDVDEVEDLAAPEQLEEAAQPEAESDGDPAPTRPVPAPRAPALPQRPTAAEVEHATRIAVLIDARRVSEDVATGLLARVVERGSVSVCRAYADWSRSDLAGWVDELRRQGLHSFHHFADDDDQALVALAIDAVDIAREAAVDEVVIAGDMTSMLPLVHRLHAASVRVVVVGPANTPHDVRAACDEFLDAELVATGSTTPVGRHRA